MKKSDTCYYMSITKEENSSFTVANQQTNNNNTTSSEPVIVTADEKPANVPTNNKDGTGPPQLILQVPTCVSECCSACFSQENLGSFGDDNNKIDNRIKCGDEDYDQF